ncbi:MAG: biopolymer transporter ExbD [Cyanomargarita calcarea GSE-NOS-MK-12-04C]|jgi:biopolymer transport protein ExbD|uniref:Biopolymer transporter ExbD n=1 Tax=Cyanomargarita calcarea GSE-NOS-MK-12-04C TaxID=2839659 RepID=A0A951UUB4_9CYAN|nr:biopolymer transporter ExbD [Cyanomargarita calcarea GSE-NOS-MK-12-04C]
MKVNLHTPVEEVQVQIIPLIDVIFCILTFFLLASLQFTRQQAINIDLPKANSGTTAAAATSQQPGGQLLVTLDAVGQIYVEKQPIQQQQLEQSLRNYIQQNPNGVLVLNASRSATYNDVIQALDTLRRVGGDRVALGIIPGPSQQPINSPFPTIPNFPINPGAPGTAPSVPINPPNPNFNLPGTTNQVPLPVVPNQPSTPEGVVPVNPTVTASPTQEGTGQTKTAPKKR